MEKSSISSYSFAIVKKDNTSQIVIYGIILLIVIIFIYYIFYSLSNQQNKDTIIFYVAKWCPNYQNHISLIKYCKKQNKVNIVVVNDYEMNKKEKQRINQFPTAIRYSDNIMAVGETDIKKLIKQTLILSNIEFFDGEVPATTGTGTDTDTDTSNNKIIFYLDNSSNLIRSAINNNHQTTYNLIIKDWNNIQDTDIDFSGNIINSFPTAVIQSNKETYYGHNEVLSLLETIYNIQLFNEAISFYVADWCPHCISLKPYIKELKNKQQSQIKINVVNYNDMTNEEKNDITGFPAAKRSGDNTIKFGKFDIERLVNDIIPDSFPPTNEGFTTNNGSNDKIIVCLADWCGHCKKFKPELTKIMETNSNIEILESEYIQSQRPELQEYIKGYPTALKISETKVVQVAVGASEIKEMIYSN
jgi:thiol-disulfide isomerase/thioredoxin